MLDRREALAAAAFASALAFPAVAEAQEIELTGPLCGAPAARGLTSLRSGAELTVASGALVELAAPAAHLTPSHSGAVAPVLGLETRFMVDRPLPDVVRMGPALGISQTLSFGAARSVVMGDVGWAFERLVGRSVELSATAGATGLTGLADRGVGSLGFHGAATLELRAPWSSSDWKPTVIGVGFDVRALEHAPPILGFSLRIGAEFPHGNGC